MKMFLIFILPLFLILSCDKKQVSLDGFEYPEGIKAVDLKSENDCSLPKCTDDRVRRLKAKDVYGIVSNDTVINIGWQTDGYITLHLCDKLDSSFIGQKVLISGDLYDACGIVNHRWPIIEFYLFKLKSINLYE